MFKIKKKKKNKKLISKNEYRRVLRSVEREINMLRSSTKMEQCTWWYFRNTDLHFEYQKEMRPYVVDFCFPIQKIVLEVDGKCHLDETQRIYDFERDCTIKQNYGFHTVRITDTGRAVLEDVEKFIRSWNGI